MPASPAPGVFLPDFVGYPICYFGIRALLPAALSAIYIDYTPHWPYASVPELAHKICDGLPRGGASTVVGYSFGAHVALEVARTLAAAGHAPRLVLVDPPALADVAALVPHDVASRLRTHPDYAYLTDLVDCELASFACMEGNIAALGRATSSPVIAGPATILLAGARLLPPELTDAGTVHHIPDCDHRSILSHPATVAQLLAALTP